MTDFPVKREHRGADRSQPYDTFLDNNSSTHDDNDHHLSEMKQKILRLKKIMLVSNILVLSSAIIIILLYFDTSLFDGVKLQDMMKSCARVEVDFYSFEECSKACSTESCPDVKSDDGREQQLTVDCEKYSDCAPLHQILSAKHHAELEDACSQENISSSKEGMLNCGNKCKISECCWKLESGEDCWEEHEQLCTNFLPCAIYYTDPSAYGMGIGPVIIDVGDDKEGN